MKIPPTPPEEEERLQKLNSLGILYTPAEYRFDRITKIAKETFNVPMALISLVDEECQWFKSAQGLTVNETPRAISFCGHAILGNHTLVISDTLDDPDFSDNPLVTEAPFIRFYAGQPLNHEGSKIGTLCIVDTKPRKLTSSDLDTLKSLASWIENELVNASINYQRLRAVFGLDNEQLQKMIDPVTGTWTRTSLDILLPKEIENASLRQTPISIILLGINNIEDIDEENEQNARDFAMKIIANKIRAPIRVFDMIFRYSSDKFLIYLSNINEESTRVISKQIISYFEEENIKSGETDIKLQCSLGVVSTTHIKNIDYAEMITLVEKTLHEAEALEDDQAIYRTLD